MICYATLVTETASPYDLKQTTDIIPRLYWEGDVLW